MGTGSWEWGDDYIDCRYEGSEETARKQVPGLVKLLGLDSPAKVLDCPCGWGRYSNPLAELGHEVVGLDFTEKFIEMAREKAPASNQPLYEVRDMRELDIVEEFDVLLNLLGSFGYYDRETDSRILKGFVDALKPGGRLMIDQYNREKLGWLPETIKRELPSGNVLVMTQSMDYEKGIYHVVDTIHDGSEKRVHELTMNWYSVDEYRNMLAKLNVKRIELYGDFDGKPYSGDSERQIVIATKPG